MRILVGCEESQVVTAAFRRNGHEAYSCDLLQTSGKRKDWHITIDLRALLDMQWDMIIAFPPCTYLTCAGNKWMKPEFKDRFPFRQAQREAAVQFVKDIANSDCPRIAIENPIGVLSSMWRRPDQIIQPYQFGHAERKPTCLWLKGLPKLQPTNIVDPEIYRHKNGKGTSPMWHRKTLDLPHYERQKARSKTFQGIANAMADQWP